MNAGYIYFVGLLLIAALVTLIRVRVSQRPLGESLVSCVPVLALFIIVWVFPSISKWHFTLWIIGISLVAWGVELGIRRLLARRKTPA
jgi:hypothetical protein